ncbi:hypothetical protein R69608_01418 [Paraburkholderia nemoris]|uniref:hypothetical protein n=1 Tax=Paraburkholderia nemoris TaxID=2793076 RepID=UPI0019145BAC|nr:hypothetical protein [Paraburkholderia nemoris]MBK5148041.1 hypothetical protein [Burkholderia sp. R-69608]CAE6876148.1 hypothetical protein R69608_01418 [Paraburkholderia nemoris]
MTAPLTKQCTRCELDLPLNEFHRDPFRAGGLAAKCKTCRKELAAERYQRDKEQILKTCAAYYAQHRTEVLERVNTYHRKKREQS